MKTTMTIMDDDSTDISAMIQSDTDASSCMLRIIQCQDPLGIVSDNLYRLPTNEQKLLASATVIPDEDMYMHQSVLLTQPLITCYCSII